MEKKWPTAKRDASCTENSSACNTTSRFRCCRPAKRAFSRWFVFTLVLVQLTVQGSFYGSGKLRCFASYDALCNWREALSFWLFLVCKRCFDLLMWYLTFLPRLAAPPIRWCWQELFCVRSCLCSEFCEHWNCEFAVREDSAINRRMWRQTGTLELYGYVNSSRQHCHRNAMESSCVCVMEHFYTDKTSSFLIMRHPISCWMILDFYSFLYLMVSQDWIRIHSPLQTLVYDPQSTIATDLVNYVPSVELHRAAVLWFVEVFPQLFGRIHCVS